MKLHLKDSPHPIDCDPKTLEEIFAFTYLPQSEYENWEVERYLRKKCTLAHKREKIRELSLWLGTLHGKQMAQDFLPEVTIAWIGEEKGYGVFADAPFQKWTYIGQYAGLVRRRKLLFPDLNDYCFMYPRQWLNFRPMTIDSEKAGNYTRFINHSDYPNLESLAVYHEGMMHVLFRAIRDIEVGEELSYDYGDVYWNKRIKIIETRP